MLWNKYDHSPESVYKIIAGEISGSIDGLII